MRRPFTQLGRPARRAFGREAVGKANRARAEAAQLYLDVAGVVMVAIDRNEHVTMINRKGCEILGYPRGEIVGANWFDKFVPGGFREPVRSVFRQLLAGEVEATGRFENPVLIRGGKERLIAWHNTVLRDPGGAVLGTLSSGEDITDRKKAEAALQRSVKELADMKFALDQSSIVAITDVTGRITYANDKFCEIAKYSREELLGQDHRIVNSRYHSAEFIRDLWRTIASGRIWHGEIRNRAKDGSLYWVDTTIVPFLDERGKPFQYLAIRNDITERKRAEETLREQEALKRLGEMAAIVAHEVKNPLAGVRGALQVIGSRLALDSADRKIVGDMVARLDNLNELIEDLLLFARPRQPRFGPVRVTALLHETVALLAKDPGMSGVTVDISGSDLVLRADGELLKTTFLNLLLNAAQAMDRTGTVRVSVDVADGRCRVRIADAGPGIPPEVRDRIFEPFFTTKHRGGGLGLTIARRSIELHRGTIAVDCPAEGGTAVAVSLPIGPG